MPAEHVKYTAQIPKYEGGANSLGNRSNNQE